MNPGNNQLLCGFVSIKGYLLSQINASIERMRGFLLSWRIEQITFSEQTFIYKVVHIKLEENDTSPNST